MTEPDNWMEIRIVIPEDEGRSILAMMRLYEFKQLDEDWCTEKREKDNATVDYAPCPEPPDRKADWQVRSQALKDKTAT